MKRLLVGLLLALLPMTAAADSPQLFKVYSVPGGGTENGRSAPLVGFTGILCDTEMHQEYILVQQYQGYGGAVGITPRINGNYCS